MEQNKPAVVSNKPSTPHKESQNRLIGAWIKTPEQKEIVLAGDDKKLDAFTTKEDKVNLIKSITSWRLHLGIKEKMSEEVKNMLDDFVVTLEFPVREVNALLNILNTPNAVPTTTFVAFINMIQQQATPQVEKAQQGLEAVAKAQDESKAAS